MSDFPGWEGPLGTRGSLMLDVVFLAMFAAIPALGIGIGLARYRRNYSLHRKLQLAIGIILLVAVIAFEVDMRLTGWTHRAQLSPYWKPGAWNDWIDFSLAIHLMFAIPTPFLWTFTIVQALRHFPSSPAPGRHSRAHIISGRLSAIALSLTALTGWVFYWLAFGAKY